MEPSNLRKTLSLAYKGKITTVFKDLQHECLVGVAANEITIEDVLYAVEYGLIDPGEIDSFEFNTNPRCQYRINAGGMKALGQLNQDLNMTFKVSSFNALHDTPPLCLDDPAQAWENYSGKVYAQETDEHDEPSGPEIPVGELAMLRLDLGLFKGFFPDSNPFCASRSVMLYDPFDMSAEDIDTFISVLSGTYFSKTLTIITSIEVGAEFIGLNVGRNMIDTILKRYGGDSGACILSPFPMQFEQGTKQEDTNKKSFEDCLSKVKNSYINMGFKAAETKRNLMIRLY